VLNAPVLPTVAQDVRPIESPDLNLDAPAQLTISNKVVPVYLVALNVTDVLKTQILVPNVLELENPNQIAHAQIIIILIPKVFAQIVIINVRHVPKSKLVTPVDPMLTEFKTD
jgi:hypothetical protein